MKVRTRSLVDTTCRHNFAAFCYRAFEVVFPGHFLQPNWHIEAICYAIECVLDSGVRPHLVLNMPPRSLKSFIVSVCLPAWLLGRNPTLRIIAASYSEDLAIKFSRETRLLMESEFYRRVFSTRISTQKSTEIEFETTRRGSRLATSVGGTLTGRGGNVLIIDDPIKADDAESEILRSNTIEWFRNTAMSRLDKPAKAKVFVVMQRLHPDDLAGLLIEEEWRHLVLPAIATETETFSLSDVATYTRAAGESLQPDWMSVDDYLARKRILGSRIFAAQFQQNPVPAEGNMVKAEWLRRYKSAPDHFERIVLACDPAAGTSEGSDYSAIVVVGIKNRHLYVLHAEQGHWGILPLRDRILSVANEWKADLCIVENSSSGVSLIPLLDEGTSLNVIGENPTEKKQARMHKQQGRFEAGRVLLPEEAPWLSEFERELLAFPAVRHDDQVDAMMLILEWFTENESFIVDLSNMVIPRLLRDNPMPDFSNHGPI